MTSHRNKRKFENGINSDAKKRDDEELSDRLTDRDDDPYDDEYDPILNDKSVKEKKETTEELKTTKKPKLAKNESKNEAKDDPIFSPENYEYDEYAEEREAEEQEEEDRVAEIYSNSGKEKEDKKSTDEVKDKPTSLDQAFKVTALDQAFKLITSGFELDSDPAVFEAFGDEYLDALSKKVEEARRVIKTNLDSSRRSKEMCLEMKVCFERKLDSIKDKTRDKIQAPVTNKSNEDEVARKKKERKTNIQTTVDIDRMLEMLKTAKITGTFVTRFRIEDECGDQMNMYQKSIRMQVVFPDFTFRYFMKAQAQGYIIKDDNDKEHLDETIASNTPLCYIIDHRFEYTTKSTSVSFHIPCDLEEEPSYTDKTLFAIIDKSDKRINRFKLQFKDDPYVSPDALKEIGFFNETSFSIIVDAFIFACREASCEIHPEHSDYVFTRDIDRVLVEESFDKASKSVHS